MLERFFLVGIDKDTPIDIREMVSFESDIITAAVNNIKTDLKAEEVVILSTCNRSEIYLIIDKDSEQDILNFFPKFFDINKDILKPYIFLKKGKDVAEHLFRVACGLESMVVGEDQILGQVKDAWAIAKREKSTGKLLNRLFLEAITLGKKVRTETKISNHSLSLSFIAVEFIKDVLWDLSDKTAYVIGAGKMGRLAIKHLLDENIGQIYISNRSIKRAMKLKNEIPEVMLIPYEKKYEQMMESDVIISATNAPHYTIDYNKFKLCYRKKRLCLIDLALPRDIDPDIAKLPGINLFTIDDLEEKAKENEQKRRKEISKIEVMSKDFLEEFIKWSKALSVVPLMRNMNEYAADVYKKEYERIVNKLDLNEKERKKLEISLNRVADKIVDRYVIGLKNLAECDLLDDAVCNVFLGGGINEGDDHGTKQKEQSYYTQPKSVREKVSF